MVYWGFGVKLVEWCLLDVVVVEFGVVDVEWVDWVGWWG